VLTEKQRRLQQQRQAGEAEYQRMLSVRPVGGSGVLGGAVLPNTPTYEPSAQSVMEAMQTLDVDWDDARSFLQQQWEEDNPGRDPKAEPLRLLRVNNARKAVRERQERNDAFNQKMADAEKQLVDEKKERCRLRGLALRQKEEEEEARQKRAAQLGKGQMLQSRLQNFESQTQAQEQEQEGGGRHRAAVERYVLDATLAPAPAAAPAPAPAPATTAMKRAEAEGVVKRANTEQRYQLPAPAMTPTPTKPKQSQMQGQANSKQSMGTTAHAPPHSNLAPTLHTGSPSSAEWYALLQLPEVERVQVLQRMLGAALLSEQEQGRVQPSSLHAAIAAVRAGMATEGAQNQRQGLGLGEALEVDGDGAGAGTPLSREELRALRVRVLSSSQSGEKAGVEG